MSDRIEIDIESRFNASGATAAQRGLVDLNQSAVQIVSGLRAATAAAGETDTKFLELVGAASKAALAVGDVAKADEIYAAAGLKASQTTDQGNQKTIQRIQLEARALAASGDRLGAINLLANGLAKEATETDKVVRADLQLIQLEKQEADAARKAADETLRLAQARARVATTSGDRAGGASILQSGIAAAQGAGASEASILGAQAQLNSALQQGTGLAEQFGGAMTSQLLAVAGPAAIAAAAIGAIKGGLDLAVAGETTNRVARSFESLAAQAGTTGDAIKAALRKASGGEISDLNIELAANKGLLLGVATNAQQFGEIMEVARDRAAKMGITTTQAFDDITTGIGRESPRILDNLGIIVDADAAHKAYAQSIGKSTEELTKAERIEALRNAVITQGKAGIDASVTAVNDQTNSLTRAGVAVGNFKDSFGAALNKELTPFAAGLANINDAWQGFIAAANQVGASLPGEADALAAFDAELQRSGDATKAEAAYQQALADARAQANAAVVAAIPAVASSEGAQRAYADSLELVDVRARAAAEAAQQKGAADQVAAVDAQTHAIAQGHLAQQAEDAAKALIAAGPAGANTAAILANSSQDVDVLTAAYYRLLTAQQSTGTGATQQQAADFRSLEVFGQTSAQKQADIKRQIDVDTAKAEGVLQNGTHEQKIAQLRKQRDEAIRTAGEGSAAAIRAQNALDGEVNRPARAGRGPKGISTLDRSETALIENYRDRLVEVNAKLAGGNLTQLQRNQYLKEQADLQNKINDAVAKQRDLQTDLALAQVHDAQDDLKAKREAAGLLRAQAGGHLTGDQQEAVALRLSELSLEDQKRANEIDDKQRQAGKLEKEVGPLANAAPAGATATPAGAAPAGATAFGAVPTQTGAPSFVAGPTSVVVNLSITVGADGRVTAAPLDPGVILNIQLAGARALSAAGGG